MTNQYHVKVENYGDDDAECLVIEIGDYCLTLYCDHDEAEACAAAINARLAAAMAARDAAWERAVWEEWDIDAEDFMKSIRQRLAAEPNPPHLPASDEESIRPKRDWSEVRQRLRDAGADRWDHQRSEREVEADLNGGGGLSNSDAGISESVIRDRDAGDEDPRGWPFEESLADFDKRCQHEEDGRDGYIERMLN